MWIYSMGNTRTTYILGATIVSIGLVFGMVWSIPGAFSDVTIDDTALLMGHASIIFTDPDGSVTYIQTDNVVHDACLNSILGGISGDAFGTASSFTTINFYTGTEPLSGDAEPAGKLSLFQTGAVYTTSIQTGNPATLGFLATFPTATFTAADTGEFVQTVALTDGAGNACSSLFLDGTPNCTVGGCGVITGTTIDVLYTINLTS